MSDLKSIADQLKLSVSTVSRALRGVPGISEKTRLRVHHCAERQGYRPDAAARSLANRSRNQATRSSVQLGLLLGHTNQNPLVNHENYRLCLKGAQAQADKMGFKVEPFWIHEPGITPKRLNQILRARGINGLILLAMSEREIDLPWDAYTSITIRNAAQPTQFHAVSVDSYSYIRKAVNTLIQKLGFQRPGLICPQTYDRARHGRISAAFRSALIENKYPVTNSAPKKTDAVSLKKWALKYQPDAILFRYRDQLPAVQEVLETPAAFFALDRIEGNQSFPGVTQPWIALGIEAVNQLIPRIDRGETGYPELPANIQLPVSWVEADGVEPQPL